MAKKAKTETAATEKEELFGAEKPKRKYTRRTDAKKTIRTVTATARRKMVDGRRKTKNVNVMEEMVTIQVPASMAFALGIQVGVKMHHEIVGNHE